MGFTTMGHLISVLLKKAFGKFPLIQFTAQVNTKDLETLAQLVRAGKLKAHVDRIYSFAKIPEAIEYIESMRTRGKVVMTRDIDRGFKNRFNF